MPFKKGETPQGAKVFKKGESGNPKGRPEGSRNLSTILKEMLAAIAPDEIVNAKFVKEFCKGKKQITNADALTARLINEGIIKGESWAVKEIFDRTDGKAPQSVDLTSNGETILATFQIDTKPKQ